MRQTKYLFIGGPRDQEWERAYGHDATYRVILRSLSAPDEIHTYYRQTVVIPGWVVPLTFYTTDPVLPAPAGTPLPGIVQGVWPHCMPAGPWRYLDNDERSLGEATHGAVKRENDRRLQR